MEKSELKNVLAVVLAVAVLGYFIYNGFGAAGWVGVAGLRADTAKKRAERVKLETKVRDAKQLVSDLPRIKKEREALEAQLREISKKLPTERESAEVLRSVESLAGKSGLTLAGVKRLPVRTQEVYAEIPMEVGVGGGYHDLVRFADQLSQLDRLVTLNQFNMQRPAPPTPGQTLAAQIVATPGTVRAQMTAVVFQALPDETAPAAPTAAGAPVYATPAVAPAR
jgi:type IV pilus assembly protein PilO